MSNSSTWKSLSRISSPRLIMTFGLNIWGGTSFFVSKAYKQLAGSRWVHPTFKWISSSSCEHKHKVFFWLLAHDRLSTRNILRRKNMFLQFYSCVLCNLSVEETDEHLFLHCELEKSCWSLLGLVVPSSLDPFQIMEHFKAQLNVPFFMEIIIPLCWNLWM